MYKSIIAATFAFALAPFAHAAGTVHINDQGCNMLDGNSAFVFTERSHAQITPSGNSMIICKVSGIKNNRGRAVRWDNKNTGYLCNTRFGITDDWFEEISTTGQATLVCKKKHN